MANELPEVIPIPAALIPEAEELSSEDFVFLLQDGHFKRMPATAFKGDQGDAATGLHVGEWKVALFKRTGGFNQLNIVYRLIKSAGELLWIEFAGEMKVPSSPSGNYSYEQITADGELSGVENFVQKYLVQDNNLNNFTARIAVNITAAGKIEITVQQSATVVSGDNRAWGLDGILYNLRQELPAIPPPPADPSISIDQAPVNVPNTSGALSVTVETTGGGWFVEDSPAWLHVSQGNGGNGQTSVTVSYDANTNTPGRSGTVIFTHAIDTLLSVSLTVTQAAASLAPVQKTVNINFEKISGTQNTDTVNVWLSTTYTLVATVTANVTVSSHGGSQEETLSLVIASGQATGTIVSFLTYLISDSDWHIALNSYSPMTDDDGSSIEMLGYTE